MFGKLQNLHCNPGAGFGIGKSMVMIERIAAAGGCHGVQLVVRQTASEMLPRGGKRVEKLIVRIIYPVHPENLFQTSFIEAAVVGDKRQSVYFRRYLFPNIRKNRGVCGIFGTKSVNTAACRMIIFRLRPDKTVKRFFYNAAAHYHHADAAYAAPLFVRSLEIYCRKIIHSISSPAGRMPPACANINIVSRIGKEKLPAGAALKEHERFVHLQRRETTNKKDMTLEQQIQEDIKAAMKAKDAVAMSAVRAIKGEILLFKTAEGGSKEVTDGDVLKMIQKLVKQRKESAEQYAAAGRQELADNELAEAAVMEKYLPAQLSAAEVEAKIKEIIAQTGAASIKEMGKVMGVATKALAGLTDGKTISEIVRKLLA